MPLRPPSEEELREYADRLSLDVTDEEVETFLEVARDRIEPYETVRDRQPTTRLAGDEVRERGAGRRVATEDDPNNAWVSRCDVRGDAGGDLDGWEVAIKDNVCVAGVEMTCGSAVLEGYVPDVDAMIVTRLLDAGARIVGKTNMDDMAMSTTGHSAFGAVSHPEDDDYLAGGSSGGSAVVVATGEVDAAIGTDQGGSIRIPAAYCGIVGLKPTYGLVPYVGSVGLEHLVDHPGPMAADVETAARMLSVIAGDADHAPRQPEKIPEESYAEDLDGDVEGLTIGVLEEAFDDEAGNEAVVETVREAVDALEEQGATVEAVSVPMHEDASAIHSVVSAEGLVDAMTGEGLGHGAKGWYNTSWVDGFGKARRAHGREFPPELKLALLMGSYTSDAYHSRYYGKGMNLVIDLTEAYDEALEAHDLLAMPTVLDTAPEHDEDEDELDRLASEGNPANTAGFNRTGNPAVSVPAGTVDGLPVGLQLVGREFEDGTVLNAAAAVESWYDSS